MYTDNVPIDTARKVGSSQNVCVRGEWLQRERFDIHCGFA